MPECGASRRAFSGKGFDALRDRVGDMLLGEHADNVASRGGRTELGRPQRPRPRLRCVSILEQQVRSGSVDITTPGQNHGDPELLSKDVQHVSYP
jgi:hypothetical protein